MVQMAWFFGVFRGFEAFRLTRNQSPDRIIAVSPLFARILFAVISMPIPTQSNLPGSTNSLIRSSTNQTVLPRIRPANDYSHWDLWGCGHHKSISPWRSVLIRPCPLQKYDVNFFRCHAPGREATQMKGKPQSGRTSG